MGSIASHAAAVHYVPLFQLGPHKRKVNCAGLVACLLLLLMAGCAEDAPRSETEPRWLTELCLRERGATNVGRIGFAWADQSSEEVEGLIQRIDEPHAWNDVLSVEEATQCLLEYDVVIMSDDHVDPLCVASFHELCRTLLRHAPTQMESVILVESLLQEQESALARLRGDKSLSDDARRIAIEQLLRRGWPWPVSGMGAVLSDAALFRSRVVGGMDPEWGRIARIENGRAPDAERRPRRATWEEWGAAVRVCDPNATAVQAAVDYLSGGSRQRRVWIHFGQYHVFGAPVGIAHRLRSAGFRTALVVSGMKTPDATAWKRLGTRAYGTAVKLQDDVFWLGLLSESEIVRLSMR